MIILGIGVNGLRVMARVVDSMYRMRQSMDDGSGGELGEAR